MTASPLENPRGDILIVDDLPVNLRLLSQMLTEHGYKVRAAANGPWALTTAQAAPPDLIVLDILMPDLDGYEVCRRLKAEDGLRDIPVLFISALGEVEDKVKGFEVGGVDYITKPFQREEVLARIHTHLSLRKLQQDLEAANTELTQRLTELQARNDELDAFAHTVAHDLKGPMANVAGFAELFVGADALLSDEQRRTSARYIVESVRKMNNIIDELLLLAGVRKTLVKAQPLNMAAIVEEARQRLAHLIQGRQVEIVVPDQWPTALGHGPWIEEVWVNYLSNAVKYGGQPPRIELGATVQDGQVRFWVHDNGDGLSSEQRARLFVPFTRLGQVETKGHGLGLSIVRRIVEKLGGEVGVESQGVPGAAASFRLRCPKRKQSQSYLASSTRRGIWPNGQPDTEDAAHPDRAAMHFDRWH
jgi:signal transduction histidine kinase